MTGPLDTAGSATTAALAGPGPRLTWLELMQRVAAMLPADLDWLAGAVGLALGLGTSALAWSLVREPRGSLADYRWPCLVPVDPWPCAVCWCRRAPIPCAGRSWWEPWCSYVVRSGRVGQ